MPSGFSPDGKVLAAPSEQDAVMKIWDLQTRQCVWKLKLEEKNGCQIMDFIFSPDSCLMAIAYGNNSILVWDIRSHKSSARLNIGRHLSLHSISFSPDMNFLLLRSKGEGWSRSNIEVWDLIAEARVTMMRCHEDDDIDHTLFSPDGQTFASVRKGGGKIQLWDWPSLLKEPPEDSMETTSVILSHDASAVVALYEKNELRAWDAATGEMLYEIHTKRKGSRIWSYKFSPDSAFMVTGRWDEVAVWNTRDGPVQPALRKDQGEILTRLSPYRRKGIRIFDCDTGQVLREIPFNGQDITAVSMAIAEDSSILALGLPSEIQIWNFESMMCTKQWQAGPNSNLILSSTGTLLAGQTDKDVRIWNWTTGEMLSNIKLSEDDWKIDAFLPDNSGIHTNYGIIPMNLGTLSCQHLTPTFRLRNHYIQWKGNDLIELPRDLRGIPTAISATNSDLTVAFACSSKRVTILKISEDEELRRLLPLIEDT